MKVILNILFFDTKYNKETGDYSLNPVLGFGGKRSTNPRFSEKFIKSFVGGIEFIRGIKRWCLHIDDHQLDEATSIKFIPF